MIGKYQAFENNSGLVNPRVQMAPRHPEKDDDGKASGKPSGDDAGSSGNDVIRMLRKELQETIRRGHCVLCAQGRRPNSRLDCPEARKDWL